jgi:hypothetical protein
MTVVHCTRCNKPFKVPDTPQPQLGCPHCRHPFRPEALAAPPGWLIVHDEQTHLQVLEILPGDNTVGRKGASSQASIQIDFGNRPADHYMSRTHCRIRAVRKEDRDGYDLLLTDLSANGTFINARRQLRLVKGIDEIYLADRDVIQLGRTKVIVILEADEPTVRRLAQDIARSRYHETIIDFQVP